MRRLARWFKSIGGVIWDLFRILLALVTVGLLVFLAGIVARVIWDLLLYGFYLW